MVTAAGTSKEYIVQSGDAGINAIIDAWIKANRDQVGQGKQFANSKAVIEWFLDPAHNKLRDPITGKPCTPNSIKVHGPLLKPNDHINTPEGNPIQKVLKEVECKTPPAPKFEFTPIPAMTPVPERLETVTSAPLPVLNELKSPQAQAKMTARGTVQDGADLQMVNFFFGRPPRDAAAEWRGTPDRARDGLKPGTQEGRRVNTAKEAGFGEETFGYVRAGNQLKLGRANEGNVPANPFANGGGEVEFGPEQTYLTDDKGNILGPNPKVNQKMEVGMRLVRDADGNLRAVEDMTALISENRRENPNYRGFLREAFTATNLVHRTTNTGEGQKLAASYLVLEKSYEQLDASFTKAPQGERSLADAEKLMQLNVQAALHPLVWSVYDYGAGAKPQELLKKSLTDVFNKLPDTPDAKALKAKYEPYVTLLDDPARLDATIQAKGGRGSWFNPMLPEALERAKLDFIRDGYTNVPMPKPEREYTQREIAEMGFDPNTMGRKERNEFKDKEIDRVARLYANKIWQDSIRLPVAAEYQLGTNKLNDPKAQQEDKLSFERVVLLDRLNRDPKAREAWVNLMLSTPAGTQKLYDTLHLTSREDSGNHALLAFSNPKVAREQSQKLAVALAGKEQGEALMREEGGSPGNSLWRMITAGWQSDGKNTNQNKGHFGFQEAMQKRWADPKTHAEVDAAVQEILGRAITSENGVEGNVTTTALVLTMDPARAQKMGAADKLAALQATLAPEMVKTINDQMVVNLNNAGSNAQVTAHMAQVEAARTLAVAAPAGGLSAAEQAARTAASKVVGFTTADPSKVSQNEMNAMFVDSAAKASPAAFTTLLVGQMIAAENAKDTALMASLRGQVAAMRESRGSAGSALAKLIDQEVAAGKAAKTPTEMMQFMNEAQKKNAAFFSGKDAQVNAIAVELLAGNLSTDTKAAGALTSAMNGQADALLAGLPGETRKQLNAIATIKDPAQRTTALKALEAGLVADNQAVTAGNGVSWVEALKLTALAILYRNIHRGHQETPQQPTPDQPIPHTPNPGGCTDCTPVQTPPTPQPTPQPVPVDPPATPPAPSPAPLPNVPTTPCATCGGAGAEPVIPPSAPTPTGGANIVSRGAAR